jgi:hypothetical protein
MALWDNYKLHHTMLEEHWYHKSASTVTRGFTLDYKWAFLVLCTPLWVNWISPMNKMYWWRWVCRANQWQNSNCLPDSPDSRYFIFWRWYRPLKFIAHHTVLFGTMRKVPICWANNMWTVMHHSNVSFIVHVSPHSTFGLWQYTGKCSSFPQLSTDSTKHMPIRDSSFQESSSLFNNSSSIFIMKLVDEVHVCIFLIPFPITIQMLHNTHMCMHERTHARTYVRTTC